MNQTMSLTMIETAVETFLRDLKSDPGRGMRNLIDLGLNFGKGRFTTEILPIAQTMLANPRSPYYRLITNVATKVDGEILRAFGINIGYHAWTRGAKIIRENEQKNGYNIPWTLIFDFERGGNRIADRDMAMRVVSEGVELGIKSFMFFSDPGSLPLEAMATSHHDCAFFLFVEPEAVDADLVAMLRRTRNIVCSIHRPLKAAESPARAFDLLSEGRCLYGFHARYSETGESAITSGKWLSLCEKSSGVFAFLIQDEDCEEPAAERIRAYLHEAKTNQRFGIFASDFYEDIARIDKIISVESCFFVIKGDGSVVSPRIAKGNPISIADMSLHEVLSRTAPKVGDL